MSHCKLLQTNKKNLLNFRQCLIKISFRFLYDIIADSTFASSRIPILIVCNKQGKLVVLNKRK